MYRSSYFISAAGRLFQRLRQTKLFLFWLTLPNRRQIAYTGVATSLAASFFSSSSDLKKNVETESLKKMQEADAYYNYYMIDNAYNILRRYRNSDDPEMLWRLGRVIVEQGKLCKNAEEKKRLFEEALEIIKRALLSAGEPGVFGAHKWYAIALNYASECQGTKSQLTNAPEVKASLERALAINPQDPTTWMILGMWHFAFADMASYTRLAARAIYANPPSSTYEEALDKFQKAETLQPNFCSTNTFYIGQIYERQGNKEQAAAYYRKVFAAPVLTADDNEAHSKASERLKKLGIKISES
ncbi:Regulator of microtubule dynamics protein 1 [Aphelenchoides bicaudatus]|nr:Regulator of microtubule dynamics protein 1 [Aphelenchoides bicaudatus]